LSAFMAFRRHDGDGERRSTAQQGADAFEVDLSPEAGHLGYAAISDGTGVVSGWSRAWRASHSVGGT
jgi:hypothetical protein